MSRNPLTQLSVLILLAAMFNPLTCTVTPKVQSLEEAPLDSPSGVAIAESILPDLPAAPSDIQAPLSEASPPASFTRSAEPIQMVVVQDITGSFYDHIAHARVAVLNLLADSQSWPEGSHIGMTTFVGGVEPDPWTPMTPTSEKEHVGQQWDQLATCNCVVHNPYRTTSFCERYYGGFDADPQMPDCLANGSASNPAASMEQALWMLEGLPGRKLIVIVGDTLPCCGSDSDPRTENLLVRTQEAGARGWDVWVISTTDVPFLDALAQNEGVARFVAPERVPEAMDRVIRELR